MNKKQDAAHKIGEVSVRYEQKALLNMRKYNNKIEKADLALKRIKEFKIQSIERNKEDRDKKMLRSKLHTLLQKELNPPCEKHAKFVERIAQSPKGSSRKKEKPEKKSLHWLESFIKPKSVDQLPDAVLLNNFDEGQLQKVQIHNLI